MYRSLLLLAFCGLLGDLAWARPLPIAYSGPSVQSGRFLIPNELSPTDGTSLFNNCPEGAVLAVGSERAYIDFVMCEGATHLIMVDFDEVVVRYNKINLALIRLAKDLEDYTHLRYHASPTEWQERAGKIGFDVGYVSELKDAQSFEFWNSKVREQNKFQATIEKLGPVHYANDPKSFARVKGAVDLDRATAVVGNVADASFRANMHSALQNAQTKISVADLSSAWLPHYTGENSTPQIASDLLADMLPESRFILTRGKGASRKYVLFGEWNNYSYYRYRGFTARYLLAQNDLSQLSTANLTQNFSDSARAQFFDLQPDPKLINRPPIETLTAQPMNPAYYPPYWAQFKISMLHALAEAVAVYPNNRLIFLARDAEYLYDLAKVLEIPNIGLLNVSRDSRHSSNLAAYLKQEGIDNSALANQEVVAVDSAFLGSIVDEIRKFVSPETKSRIRAHLLCSRSPEIPMSLAFWENFPAGVNREDIILAFQELPHFGRRSTDYALVDGRWEPISAYTPDPVAQRFALRLMQDLKAFGESAEARETFASLVEHYANSSLPMGEAAKANDSLTSRLAFRLWRRALGLKSRYLIHTTQNHMRACDMLLTPRH